MDIDFIIISGGNSFGDPIEKEMENPTCDELVQVTTAVAQKLGYSLSDIFFALTKESEAIKQQIFLGK